MARIHTYSCTAAVWLGCSEIPINLEVDYTLHRPISGNRIDPYEPLSVDLIAWRWQINGQYIGVEELRLSNEQQQHIAECILEQHDCLAA